MSSATPVPWGEFSQDPRRPESAGLRASDRDRDLVHGVLNEGYADGRLTKDEYDERTSAVAAAKTLGQLTPIIADLVPHTVVGAGSNELVLATPEELRRRALEAWDESRRNAASGLVFLTVLLSGIWFVTGRGFYWPFFVMLVAATNLLRVQLNKRRLVAEELRKLEKRQRKALGGS